MIDEGIEALTATVEGSTDEQVVTAAARQAADLLRRHIYVEEAHLFPALLEIGLVGPILVMISEHGQLWDILDQLSLELARSGDVQAAAQIGRELLSLLAIHNMKEENVVYPTADRDLSAEHARDLITTVAEALVPAGWVCEAAAARTPTDEPSTQHPGT